jgi:F-type H+-transporting ATPase subunit alpha
VSRVGGSAQIGPMKKVAGRLKIELSQFRDLEAFAQFGSDLDADTQRTLARGERLVATLNQDERSPMPVEEQVVQVFAATNGFLDRITTDRVGEFLDGLTQRIRAEQAELLERVRSGDWSDETQDALKSAIAEYADDFGYDLDEDGAPVSDDDAPTRASDGVRASRDEGGDDADGGADGPAAEGDERTEEAGAVSA